MARTQWYLVNQSLKVIPEQNLTAASRKVSELVSSRGRKGTDAKFIPLVHPKPTRSSTPACDSIWREVRKWKRI